MREEEAGSGELSQYDSDSPDSRSYSELANYNPNPPITQAHNMQSTDWAPSGSAPYLRIGVEEFEGFLHLFLRSPAAHVEKIRRVATLQLDDVHGRHRQPRAIHWARTS